MTEPLITTIIPTFRRPQLLKRAISSVLRQTYGNFQVCVYDNASGDGTADVVAELARSDSRVKYHCHPENIGGGANFNYALARVSTPYFSFLSDDDILLPEFYETAMAGFRKFPEVGFFAGSGIVMTDDGEVLTVPLDLWPGEEYFPPRVGVLQLIDRKLPVWTSILFRKAATDKVGALDLGVGGAIDLDFQLRLACRYPFLTSRTPCGIFVSHGSSSSATPRMETYWPGWLQLIRNVAEHPEIPQEVRNQARHGLILYIGKILFSIGLKFIRVKDFAAARAASDVLRCHLGQHIRPLVLSAASRICALGRLPHRSYAFAYDFARVLRKTLDRNHARLQGKYGQYAKWL